MRSRRIIIAASVAPVVIAALVVGLLVASGRSTRAGESPSAGSLPAGSPLVQKALGFTLGRDDGVTISPNARNLARRTGSTGPLLLFLPATRSIPTDYTSFVDTAAKLGYHVLALDYWNRGMSVQKTCGADAGCYTSMQRNRLDGTDPTRFSAIDPRDSIKSRLRMAIGYLNAHDPKGGWGRYVDGTHIRWKRIVVSGHSQGGGESAYIAHEHRVRGALLFGSPVATTNGVSASWLATPGATPASQTYAFDSTNDVFFDKIRPSWTKLGLDAFGAPANTASPPPYNSHELVTSLHLGTPGASHRLMITDHSPRLNGSLIFRPVWRWMLKQLL